MSKTYVTRILAFVIALTFTSLVQAGEIRPLVAGSDYEEMKPAGSKTPIIYEFFNYGCPHCYQFLPIVHEFKNQHPEVRIQYVAIDLHPQWAWYTKAYYVTELLKNNDVMHDKIFHRAQVERKPITSESDLIEFFVANGVDEAKVKKALKSFSFQAKLRKGKQLAREYKVTGTPTFVINERYKLNNQKLGSREMIIKAMADLSKQISN